MAAVGGLELIFFAILGLGPAMLIGAFFLFLASGVPAPQAPRRQPAHPPAMHAEPPAAHAARPAPISNS